MIILAAVLPSNMTSIQRFALIIAILAFIGLEIISQNILQHKLNLISKKTKSESSDKNLVMA